QFVILTHPHPVRGNFTRRQRRRLHIFTAKQKFCNFTSLAPYSFFKKSGMAGATLLHPVKGTPLDNPRNKPTGDTVAHYFVRQVRHKRHAHAEKALRRRQLLCGQNKFFS
ncbi:MAG: hypothetical protein IKA32_06885, partial [Lentisphaeria bacterium]|nr:hypothetical protein [Lentisphaeria bacterium]